MNIQWREFDSFEKKNVIAATDSIQMRFVWTIFLSWLVSFFFLTFSKQRNGFLLLGAVKKLRQEFFQKIDSRGGLTSESKIPDFF